MLGHELLCVIDHGTGISGWWCYPDESIIEDDFILFSEVLI